MADETKTPEGPQGHVDEPPTRAWWISLNVTRTRVSLLGFNLTLIAFLVSMLLSIHEELAFSHHLPAMSSLFLGFCLSMFSTGSLLCSQELDEEGLSRPLLFSLGDLLMYLALSQTAAGLSRKYLSAVAETLDQVALGAGTGDLARFLEVVLSGLALVAWGLLFYVGPLMAIVRSPVGARLRGLLLAVYLLAVAVIVTVATQVHLVQDLVLGESEPTLRLVLRQFIQPLTF